jgi:hypothetical protein
MLDRKRGFRDDTSAVDYRLPSAASTWNANNTKTSRQARARASALGLTGLHRNSTLITPACSGIPSQPNYARVEISS